MNVLLHAIQKAGDVEDTTKIAAAFAEVLPMEFLQGDQVTLGGKDRIGVNNQLMAVVYIGTIKNGEPVISRKVK